MHPESSQHHDPQHPDRQVNWNRTELAGNRVKKSGEFQQPTKEAPYGWFADRPIIGSKMDHIIGGVYIGRYAREAIVVDDREEKTGDLRLAEHYEKFKAKIQKHFERINPTGMKGLLKKLRYQSQTESSKTDYLLRAIYLDVLESIPYSGKTTDLLIEHLSKGMDDRKIHLAAFIKNKTGVCRHQALLAAYLMEKLMNETDPSIKLDGKFSIERNSVADIDENVNGAHVWVRYTDNKGEAWILDAAQHKIGKLKDVIKDPKAWEYARPDEYLHLKAS